MAERMFPEIMGDSDIHHPRSQRARRKCRSQLKRIIVGLNRRLDTPQVKMCANPGRWGELDFNNLTSLTLAKNRKGIMNLTKKQEQRSAKEDRIKCATRFAAHIQAAKNGSNRT